MAVRLIAESHGALFLSFSFLSLRVACRIACSTKIVALVRALKSLEEGEKAIVFSEWEDMLALLSHALKKNGIEHLRCKGSKAISKGLAIFKKDPG